MLPGQQRTSKPGARRIGACRNQRTTSRNPASSATWDGAWRASPRDVAAHPEGLRTAGLKPPALGPPALGSALDACSGRVTTATIAGRARAATTAVPRLASRRRSLHAHRGSRSARREGAHTARTRQNSGKTEPSRGGEIGKRSGLKIRRPRGPVGSIPTPGTTRSDAYRGARPPATFDPRPRHAAVLRPEGAACRNPAAAPPELIRSRARATVRSVAQLHTAACASRDRRVSSRCRSTGRRRWPFPPGGAEFEAWAGTDGQSRVPEKGRVAERTAAPPEARAPSVGDHVCVSTQTAQPRIGLARARRHGRRWHRRPMITRRYSR